MPLFVTVTPGTTVTNSTTLDATTLNLLGTPSVDVTGTVDGGSLTLSAGSVTTVAIADNAVTFAKLDNIDGDRLIGRDDAGSGDPTQISVGGGLQFTGSNSIEIGNGLVTYAKIQNTAAGKRLIGRAGTAGGIVDEIEVGSGLSLSDGGVLTVSNSIAKFTNQSAFGVPKSTDSPAWQKKIAHSLTATPNLFKVYAIWNGASASAAGYTNGQKVDIDSFYSNAYRPAFICWADATYVYISRSSYENGVIYCSSTTGGNGPGNIGFNLTSEFDAASSNWTFSVDAIRFT